MSVKIEEGKYYRTRNGMDVLYPHIYRMLKAWGHSHEKAIEIILDAARGDLHRRRWIYAMFLLRRA